MKISFKPNGEHGQECEILARDKAFWGWAECHPTDYDFENEKTGQELAFYRALMQEHRDQIRLWKSQEQVLLHIMDCYKQHPDKYHLESPEVTMVAKQLHYVRRDIAEYKAMIKAEQEAITTLIKEKDLVYRKVRALRERRNGNSEHTDADLPNT